MKNKQNNEITIQQLNRFINKAWARGSQHTANTILAGLPPLPEPYGTAIHRQWNYIKMGHYYQKELLLLKEHVQECQAYIEHTTK